MMFGHGGEDNESIFKLVDQMERGIKAAGDINEPLDVAQHDGKLCSLSNRRLTALMMFQSLHRDIVVKAWCKICSDDTQKFEEANSTSSDGLAIEVREGESQHFGAPLFQRGEYAMHELQRVSERHPDDLHLFDLLSKLRVRRSLREPDGCSLTCTQASQALHESAAKMITCRSFSTGRGGARHK
jgi:hypothetical protein